MARTRIIQRRGKPRTEDTEDRLATLETKMSDLAKNPTITKDTRWLWDVHREDPKECEREWGDDETQGAVEREDKIVWGKLSKAMDWNRAWLSVRQKDMVRAYELWKPHAKEDGDDEKVKETKDKVRRRIIGEIDEMTEVMKKLSEAAEQDRHRSKISPQEGRHDIPFSVGDAR